MRDDSFYGRCRHCGHGPWGSSLPCPMCEKKDLYINIRNTNLHFKCYENKKLDKLCPHCKGSGYTNYFDKIETCNFCFGTGGSSK